MTDETKGRPITRRDLPAVVRRAAELAAVDDDADEELPEDEVIRIAAELGLEARHVRQALYEGAHEEDTTGLLDRHFGLPRILAARAVPLPPERARRALEDYFVTHEYLQAIRRQQHSTIFEPATDTFSKIARAFQRSSKHQLAQATGVEISVRALEPNWSHVRVRALYEDNRRAKVTGAVVGGVVLGLPAGALATGIVFVLSGGLIVPEAAVTLGGVAGIATFSSIVAGAVASARTQWRRWRDRTQLEADAVLDRLEKGDDLRPPPAPWLRKLQMKLGQK